MRQQQVDVGRFLGAQGLVDGNRIVDEVDRGEYPGVEVAVLQAAQQPQRVKYLGMAAPAVGEPPMPVIGRLITVE
jgi:hypothetical protein